MALEAADRFCAGLAFGSFAGDVGLRFGVAAQGGRPPEPPAPHRCHRPPRGGLEVLGARERSGATALPIQDGPANEPKLGVAPSASVWRGRHDPTALPRFCASSSPGTSAPCASARYMSAASTRRLTCSAHLRPSLRKMELMCFSTARLVSTRWSAIA